MTLLLAFFTLSLTYAANITVTSGADSGPGSLRQAVMDAAPGDVVIFAGATNGTAIVLSSMITLDKDLSIVGNGMGTTIVDGGGTTRIFNITGEANVTLRLMTITNGMTMMSGGAIQNLDGDVLINEVMVSNSVSMATAADMGAGGIHNAGRMDIRNSVIMGNTATQGSGSGGGILNRESGTLILRRTNVMNNEANRAGGGIEVRGGELIIRGGTFSGNVVNASPGNGGAIHTGGANSSIAFATFDNNTAGQEGGAVWNAGTMRLDRNTITNNVALGTDADDGGGGVFNQAGTLTIVGGSIMGNTATATNETGGNSNATSDSGLQGISSGSGGGILSRDGTTLNVRNVMIMNNEANRAGGGIEIRGGTFSIQGGAVSNNVVNTSPGNGGGIHTGGGTSTIEGTTFDGNIAGQEGGGLWNGGVMNVSNATITNNYGEGLDADDGGGGVFNNAGTLVISNSIIDGNFANGPADITIDDGGGDVVIADMGSGSGGGILNMGAANMAVINCTITNNVANRAGGGIEVRGGNVDIRGGSVSNNIVSVSPGNGGGIHTGGGNTTIEGTTFDGNEAGQEGGGVWNGGTMEIKRSMITNNVALGTDADDGGGGVFNQAGSLTITGGSIMNNTATATNETGGTSNEEDGSPLQGTGSGSGGGILNRVGANLVLLGVTVDGNEANRAGGGIEVRGGTVDIRGGSVSNNVVNASPGNGGGIHTGGGDTNIDGTTFDGNMAGQEGGGVWNGGTMKLARATVSNNIAMGTDADDGGGGVFNQAGDLTIVGGSITGNTAIATNETGGNSNEEDGSDLQGTGSGSGGGVLNRDGANLTILNVAINGNEANRAGGGIEVRGGTVIIRGGTVSSNVVNTSPGNGGGIHTGGGDTDIAFTTFEGNEAGQEGGGVWNGGTMTINRARIVSNIALGDDADDGGGGVFNQTGDLTIRRTLINNNEATGTSGSGGGILSRAGNFTIRSSNVSGNTANRAGGGAEVIDGTYTSFNTNYRNNVAGEGDSANPGSGGAFHITGMSSTVDFSGGTVSGNSAANTGGGLWNQAGTTMTVNALSIMDNNADNDGGGIWNNGGTLNVVRSLVANNTTGGEGGGVYNGNNGTTTIMVSTVSGNDAAGVYDGSNESGGTGGTQVMGSTVAMNAVGLETGLPTSTSNISFVGSIIAMNTEDNIIGDNITDNGESVLGAGADLQPLADNGGPTMTHAIGMNSDAIDLYTSSTDADQRGVAPMGNARDAGAFESDFTVVNNRAVVETGIDVDLNTEVISAYPNPVTSDRVQVNIPAQMTEAVELRLLDQNGRVHTVRDMAPGTHNFTLPISDLTPGTYTLQAISGDQSSTTRIVVIR